MPERVTRIPRAHKVTIIIVLVMPSLQLQLDPDH